jgi:hypothetical protein
MDARQTGLGGVVCLLSLLVGCELFQPTNQGPASREAQPASDPPPPQIVQQPQPQPMAAADAEPQSDLDPRVAAYLDQLQGGSEGASTQPEDAGSAAPVTFPATIPVQRVDTMNRRQAPGQNLPAPRLVLVDDDASPAIDVTDIPVGVSEATSRGSGSPAGAPQLNGVIVNGGPILAGNSGSGPAPSSGNAQGFVDILQAVRNSPSDDSFRSQLDNRVMHVIAGEYAQAREPLRLVTDEQQALASSLIETLIVSRDEFHLGNQDSAATKMNLELNNLVRSLGKVSDLRIPRFAICAINGIRGYGNYDPLEPAEFVTGQPVALATYCEVQNLRTEQDSKGWHRSELDMQTTVLTAGGDVILDLNDRGIVDRCVTPRNDFFVARPIQLPATLAPGSYVIKTTIKDTLGEKVAQGRAEFRVVVR